MPNLAKQLSSKRFFARLTAERDHWKFAFMGALALGYKSGQFSRQEILEALRKQGITRDDARRFFGPQPSQAGTDREGSR